MSEKFIVNIPVKPYVKRFIEINYGLPADFSKHPRVNEFFLDKLKHPDTSRDRQYPDQLCTYTETLEVVISQHDFYKHGWELSKTDIVAFGKYFEDRAKLLMRLHVGSNHALGRPINVCIEEFQDDFCFDENVWKYEAIKKDFFRNGHKVPINFKEDIFDKIKQIVLHNLYDLGTISKDLIIDHEKY